MMAPSRNHTVASPSSVDSEIVPVLRLISIVWIRSTTGMSLMRPENRVRPSRRAKASLTAAAR